MSRMENRALKRMGYARSKLAVVRFGDWDCLIPVGKGGLIIGPQGEAIGYRWPRLAEARARRDAVRARLARGEDPRGGGGDHNASMTFEELARHWHARRRDRWSDQHAADVIASLERHVFPTIGELDPASIDARALIRLLMAVEGRGRIETARRLRERLSGIFRAGITLGVCAADPAALIKDELAPRPRSRPQPALLTAGEARELLAAADAAPAPRVVKLASRLLALTAVRMAALRGAACEEFDALEDPAAARWIVPPSRMKVIKVRKDDPDAAHIVPLSWQAIAVLAELRELTGGGGLILPGRRAGRPIGEGAIGDLYAAAGYAGRHVPHGWRASFSTILNELYPAERQLIDAALAHAGKGKVEAAYNRARHLERLRDLMQRWADLIMPE